MRIYDHKASLCARRRLPRERGGDGGFTIIEILVALAIVGLLYYAMATSMRKFGHTELRESAVEVAAVLKASYNMSASTGVHHRVMIDIENGVFRIEACPSNIKLKRSEEEEVLDPEKLAELLERKQQNTTDLPEILAASSPEEAAEAAAALAGVRIGTARCQPPKLPTGDADGRGTQRKLSSKNIKFKNIHVQHLEDDVDEGIVSINFFPLGYAEKAVIELADDDRSFWILVHRLTGRIEFVTEDNFDPDEHMRRNGAGDSAGDEDR